MSSEIAVRAVGLSKAFEFYESYTDRFKQILFGRFKTYYTPYWVLRDINFTINRGQCVGIVGRNGVGKSTLLQLICGISEPTAGHIISRGRLAPVLSLGAGFDADLSGRDNAIMASVVLGLSRTEAERRLDDIANFAQIGPFLERPVKLYSTGMFARLAFAICAHIDPEIFIIDEVLAVGDAAFQEKCVDFLGRFRKSGGTLIFVSHSMQQICELCDTAMWIDNGRLRLIGDPAAIATAYSQSVREDGDTSTRFDTAA